MRQLDLLDALYHNLRTDSFLKICEIFQKFNVCILQIRPGSKRRFSVLYSYKRIMPADASFLDMKRVLLEMKSFTNNLLQVL